MKVHKKREFTLPNYGTLKLDKDPNGFYWFGDIKSQISSVNLELTIEVNDEVEPSQEQIHLIKEFEINWTNIQDLLFEYMESKFKDSKWEKEKKELKDMYYLTSVYLKRNNSELWIVLEPEPNVESIFNFFPRFTLSQDKIKWSNIK